MQQAAREDNRTMSDFVREAARLYLEEREWLRQERRERAKTRLNKEKRSQGGNTDE